MEPTQGNFEYPITSVIPGIIEKAVQTSSLWVGPNIVTEGTLQSPQKSSTVTEGGFGIRRVEWTWHALSAYIWMHTNWGPNNYWLLHISKSDASACPTCGPIRRTYAHHFLLSWSQHLQSTARKPQRLEGACHNQPKHGNTLGPFWTLFISIPTHTIMWKNYINYLNYRFCICWAHHTAQTPLHAIPPLSHGTLFHRTLAFNMCECSPIPFTIRAAFLALIQSPENRNMAPFSEEKNTWTINPSWHSQIASFRMIWKMINRLGISVQIRIVKCYHHRVSKWLRIIVRHLATILNVRYHNASITPTSSNGKQVYEAIIETSTMPSCRACKKKLQFD